MSDIALDGAVQFPQASSRTVTRSRLSRALRAVPRVGSRALEEQIESRTGQSILKLGGSPELPWPEHVLDAAIDALHETGSRPSRGIMELREALVAHIQRESHVSVDPLTGIMVTDGAMQALNICFRALLDPGDRVLVPAPTFFFDGLLRLAQAEPTYVRSDASDGWSWNIDRFEAAVDDRTKAILLCNPTNPTGYLPSQQELAAVIELANRHDLIVISDESYDRYIYDGGRFTSALASDDGTGRVVIVNSLSKSFALATWRLGYIVAPPELLDGFAKLQEWELLHPPFVAQRVGAAAVNGPQDWIVNAIRSYQGSRDMLLEALRGSSWLAASRPSATPFLCLDVSRFDTRDHPADEQLLDIGIPTVPADSFAGTGFVRLPFGGTRDTIEELAGRLRAFVPAHLEDRL